jgi:pyruvate,water dikinase
MLLFRLIYGRPYLNLTALSRGFESLPFSPPAALGGSEEAPAKRRLPGLSILPVLWNVINIVLTSHRQWERLLPPFIAAVEQESALDWETMPTAAILEGITRHEVQTAALMANHAAASIAAEPLVQILQKLTHAWLGDKDGQIAITLLSGLTGNKTVETNRALWRLAVSTRGNDALRQAIAAAGAGGWREPIALASGGAAFLAGFDAFLQAYGHRTQGYDMMKPTWRERPDLVLELLRLSFDDSVADPGEGEARKAAERESAVRAARQRLSPPKRFLFDRVLSLAQTYFRLRENQQFYLMQGVPLSRRTLLTLGHRFQETGLLNEVEDVFFLENIEVRALAAKMAGLPTDGFPLPADPLHLVTERRAEFECNRQTDAPIHLGGKSAQPEAQTGGALRGIPASRGVVTGKARLIRTPADFHALQRGEIIIAPATTPAWTPLFGVAAGLVTEFGGLLSHSGVVAREYGLPAVLGVADIMRLLHDGDEIEVDGERGEVRVK